MEIERRSQHKSIEELEKEVGSKKSEICKLWRVKEKEKNSWRKKSLEDEVGWCYEHKDFCDINSACPTWDPIPATSLEGKLLLAISRASNSDMYIYHNALARKVLKTCKGEYKAQPSELSVFHKCQPACSS